MAKAHLARREWQQAIDVIVNEAVRTGQIDRSRILGGRVHFDAGVGGEGETRIRGFRRDAATGAASPLARPVRVGADAFTKFGGSIAWLYSSILHEYQHVAQFQTASGLPTTESQVPGQGLGGEHTDQKEVETYATEIFKAQLTGVSSQPAQIRELWKRCHDHWKALGAVDRRPVRDLYLRAHAAGEALLGGPGTLPNFSP